MSYTKKINKNEYYFYLYLEGTGITPDIISITEDELNIVKYDTTLQEILYCNRYNNSAEKTKQITNGVKKLIEKLHDLYIFHYDLHDLNIVCNKEGTDFRIIDFEHAMFFNEITKNTIKNYNIAFDWARCKTIEDLLKFELNESWK